jgi:hypothetical protein
MYEIIPSGASGSGRNDSESEYERDGGDADVAGLANDVRDVDLT